MIDANDGTQTVTETMWHVARRSWSWIAVAGICALCVTRVFRNARNKQRRKEWDKTGKDVVLLHQFKRGKFCPNLSPFALKVETFLRLANIQYKVDEKNPFGPKGKCPWITINGKDIADSEYVLEELTQHFNVQLDIRLEAREAAVLEAVRILADEHLFWCVITWRYWLDGCVTFLKSQNFSRFLHLAFPIFMKKGIKKKAQLQGIGIHSPEQIYQICSKDCSILASILGDRSFFGGEDPSRADCAVFGQLAQLMWNAPGSRYEALLTEVYPSLSSYCLRMKQRVFPDWDTLVHPE